MSDKAIKRMECTIFYSWLSDVTTKINQRTNRSFIQTALKNAATIIAKDDSIEVVPRIDEATKGIAGAVDIAGMIFSKIKQADIFVGDVSIINDGSKFRRTPNPNVLIEYGYAKLALPFHQHILIFNDASGNIRDIPFDLQGIKLIQYHLSANQSNEERLSQRKNLEQRLAGEIRSILENTRLRKSNIPELRLKLIENSEYNDEIIFIQKVASESYSFGLSLQNITEGSMPADKIAIRVEFYWQGNDLQYAPHFTTHIINNTGRGWQEQEAWIRSDKPALWIYHGDNDSCAFGYPRDWRGFSVRLKEKVDGRFQIHYQISSVLPHTNNSGMLQLIMR
jgi:hypothetical protein